MSTKMSRVEHFEFSHSVVEGAHTFFVGFGALVGMSTLLLGATYFLPGNPLEVPGVIPFSGVIVSIGSLLLARRIRKTTQA